MRLDILNIKENNGSFEFSDSNGNNVVLSRGQLTDIFTYTRRLYYKELIQTRREDLDEESVMELVEYLDDRYYHTDSEEETWLEEAFEEMAL